MYRFLGHGLLEPVQKDRALLLQPSFWEQFPLEPANDAMTAALGKLAAVTAGLAALPQDAALEQVQLEYAELFLGTGDRQALPWESLYRTPERLMFGPPAMQVRAVMAQFGVEVAAKYRQPEDHLGLELMLLAAASEAAADQADWRESARRQAAFIAEHPLAWIADLERDATDNGSTGFYAAVIGLIRGVLLWDRELLDEYAAAD
ncbi:MAG TPA: molecular chaperone TorD family protein [Negativicutes bacterium]|nr:molecular chaperone TorD family protein [Negativicutes bacterium]